MLLALAVLLGGGGVAYGFHNLAVQLAALALLAINGRGFARFWREAPLMLKALVALTLALPLVQLLPLPPQVWQSLPARAIASEALESAGLDPGWRPLSLDPARTLVAALGLIVPLAVLGLGWSLSRTELVRLGWIVVGLGMVGFAWGVPQVISNGATAVPYPENPMPGVMFASFANRNSAGVFFLLCLAFALWLRPASQTVSHQSLRAAAIAVLVLAVWLTQSRSAIILSALLLALAALGRLVAWHRAAPGNSAAMPRPGKRLALVAGGLILLIALALASLPGTRIETALDRFTFAQEGRIELWEDAAHSAGRFWPAGAGMGTFDEVFQLDESLEHLGPRTAGRAHNDYLEIAIEAGVAGLALVLAWMVVIAALAWRGWRSRYRALAVPATLALAAIAAQSLTDYPLRNQAMLALAALCIAMVARAATPTGQGEER